jgi:hypothetical protein
VEKPGTVRKSEKQQAEDAELELIIERMANAMRNGNRYFVSRVPACRHDVGINFTPSMEFAWDEYKEFCRVHPRD